MDKMKSRILPWVVPAVMCYFLVIAFFATYFFSSNSQQLFLMVIVGGAMVTIGIPLFRIVRFLEGEIELCKKEMNLFSKHHTDIMLCLRLDGVESDQSYLRWTAEELTKQATEVMTKLAREIMKMENPDNLTEAYLDLKNKLWQYNKMFVEAELLEPGFKRYFEEAKKRLSV